MARALRLRLRIYAAIFLVALVVLVVDVVRLGWSAAAPVTLGLAAGAGVGVVASRMSRLSWDTTDATVVGRVDGIGAVILVGYLALTVFRDDLLATWFDPPVVGVAGVATLAGLMVGQVLGTVGGVVRVLRVVSAGPDTPDDDAAGAGRPRPSPDRAEAGDDRPG